MTALTREWVEKAEDDYHAAWLLVRARKHPNYDGSCFHAQQCVEKYLKALLQHSGKPIKRTHNLLKLLDTIRPLEPTLELRRPDLHKLTTYGVAFRYPGNSADKELAREAVLLCRHIRDIIRLQLGLIRGKDRKKARKKKKKITTKKTAKKNK